MGQNLHKAKGQLDKKLIVYLFDGTTLPLNESQLVAATDLMFSLKLSNKKFKDKTLKKSCCTLKNKIAGASKQKHRLAS